MQVLKEGGRQLFQKDPATARVVSEMLVELEQNGMDAVRRYSARFDHWDPPDFELDGQQIAVELNRLILKKDSWEEHALEVGDVVEIVHFVGGGNDRSSEDS